MNRCMLDRIHDRYGELGAFLWIVCMGIICAALLMAWGILTIMFIWPGVLPPLIVAYMTLKATRDPE